MSERDRLSEAIAADVVPPPPEGLAARVADAVSAGEPPPRSRRLRWVLPSLATFAAGAALAAAGLHLRAPAREAVTADERQPAAQETIRVGERAVLVAEAGAALRWRPDDREGVVVEQGAGEVFYRVDRGPWLVQTPFGVARVRGTCFRVEVTDMKLLQRQNLVAALGAAVGAAVVVTVYEGRVLLANGAGEVELAPGERGELPGAGGPRVVPADTPRVAPRPGEPPRKVAAAAAAAPRFIVNGQPVEQAAETPGAPAHARRVEVQEALVAGPHVVTKLEGAKGKGRFLDPDKEELLARAERCEVRSDGPDLEGVSKQDAQRLGLADTERDAMNEALEEVKAHVAAELRRLYVEMGGDAATADRLASSTLEHEILARAPPGSQARARAQLARERAGLAAPPADPAQTPVAERAYRLTASTGDLFERKLAERLGPERAHALRARDDGWGRKNVQRGCE